MKLQRLTNLLGAVYPHVTGMLDGDAGDVLGTLVLTLLSQSTTDRQAQAAYRRLRQAYPDWHQVAEAPQSAVAAQLKAGGLHQQKAARIQSILERLAEEGGELSLEWLRQLEAAPARDFLESLPGVGPKTAACVLLFSLGKPALPVDTHVARVARRLGLVPLRASALQVQQLLEPLVPAAAARHFHLALIEHGRSICRSQRPRCPDCPLAPECDYWKESLTS